MIAPHPGRGHREHPAASTESVGGRSGTSPMVAPPGRADTADMSSAPFLTPTRTLRRCTTHRMVAGVAAGLAEYFDLDPLGVRIAFVVLAVAGGLAVPVYAALWLLVPADRLPGRSPRTTWSSAAPAPDLHGETPMSFAADPPPSWVARPAWWTAGAGGAHVDPGSMRVSDAERTEVTDALCKHFADGRLDEGELNDRVARATAAKTRAELAPILADLPPLGHVQHPQVPVPSRRRNPLLWAVVSVLCAPFLLGSAFALGAAVFARAHAVSHALVPLAFVAVVILVVSRRRGRHPVS